MHPSHRFVVLAATLATFSVAALPSYAAPFVVTPTTDATQLAQNIVGAGVTLTGTPTLTGATGQAGTFVDFTTGPYTNPVTGASGEITMASGIILSSGRVADAAGTYQGGASTNLGGPGDADLTAISGFTTLDAVALTFEFVPTESQIFISFLFASTEYPNFVNSQFNDVFGFFVNGTNVALVPGTTDPVTINSINVGNPVGVNPSNPQFFTRYSVLDVTPFNYGGATVLLTVAANVNPNVVNTFKFAIADASDRILDSAVLIGAGQFTVTPPGQPPPNGVPEPGVLSLLGLGAIALVRRRLTR
jgi:MYXO-CTERM domain-containing protein